MDLMYGCGGDFDMSFQDLIECDLKSEMERIIAAANNPDFMHELAGPLITEEGFDEFDIKLDGMLGDPFGLGFSLLGNLNEKSTAAKTAAPQSQGKKRGAVGNTIGFPAMMNLEEHFGVLVDPSSIIPVSVSSSASASCASGSEIGDADSLGTEDEDEDGSESELIGNGLQTWIVPSTSDGASRSPSPTTEPEYDPVEEPEFINIQHPRPIPIVEGPPPKKRKQKHEPQPHIDGKIYPKPAFSYSCLIAMSLKNSKTGSLPVSEIYKFMCDHFPYFKTAPSGWKNSVRHNLSLNKCFEKIEKPGNGARKGCLWALNPAKIHKMDEEVQKWSRKDPLAIRRAMSDPENLEMIERGELKRDYSGNAASDEDEEEDFSEPATPLGLSAAQLASRRSRGISSDSLTGTETYVVTSSGSAPTAAQVHAALNRPHDQKIHKSTTLVSEDGLEFGTITSVQGNYLCHPTGGGGGTYTLSFSPSTTPLIIRRTPVK